MAALLFVTYRPFVRLTSRISDSFIHDGGYKMPKNMGSVDRIVRVVFALAVAVLYFTDVISGTVAIILGVLALVFLATSIIGFCPLYMPFKFSTNKK
jgi:hypothetical protein